MAEWARLLSECWVKPVAGSNPALPATRKARSILNRTRFSFLVVGSHISRNRKEKVCASAVEDTIFSISRVEAPSAAVF